MAMVARAWAGRITPPKVKVEDGEMMPARAGSVCEICVRAGDAVEGLKVPYRGPGGRHGCLPPGCSVRAREDGYAVCPVQLGPANSLADEVDRGRRTKSGLRRLHQGQGELDQLSCCRASVPEARASGVAEKKRSH